MRSPRLLAVLFVLSLAGAALASYLTALHYGMLWGDLSLARACGAAGSSHCGAVVASRYGTWATLPVALFGLWFYVAAACFALIGFHQSGDGDLPALRGLWWLGLVALIADAGLGWAMWTRLRTTCALCVVSYGVNAVLFALATLALRARGASPLGACLPWPERRALHSREAPGYHRAALTQVLLGVVVAVVIGTGALAVLGNFSAHAKEESNVAGLLQYLETATPLPVPAGERTIGPRGAPVSITVFSDFTCENCKTLSRYLSVLAADHRDDLEISYRHYTLDPACNPGAQGEGHGSCRLAHAAECARQQGRFWEFHDAVFADDGPSDPERIDVYASRAGLDLDRLHACMADSAALDPVRRDIALGDSLEVDATPTVFLNGRAVVGVFKPWIWEQAYRVVRGLPR